MVKVKFFHTNTFNFSDEQIMLFAFLLHEQFSLHLVVCHRDKNHGLTKLIMAGCGPK